MNPTLRPRSSADIRTLGKRKSVSHRGSQAAEFLNLYVLKNEQERLKQEEASLTDRLRRVRERLAEVEAYINRGLRGIEPAEHPSDGESLSDEVKPAPEPIELTPSLRRVSVSY